MDVKNPFFLPLGDSAEDDDAFAEPSLTLMDTARAAHVNAALKGNDAIASS